MVLLCVLKEIHYHLPPESQGPNDSLFYVVEYDKLTGVQDRYGIEPAGELNEQVPKGVLAYWASRSNRTVAVKKSEVVPAKKIKYSDANENLAIEETDEDHYHGNSKQGEIEIMADEVNDEARVNEHVVERTSNDIPTAETEHNNPFLACFLAQATENSLQNSAQLTPQNALENLPSSFSGIDSYIPSTSSITSDGQRVIYPGQRGKRPGSQANRRNGGRTVFPGTVQNQIASPIKPRGRESVVQQISPGQLDLVKNHFQNRAKRNANSKFECGICQKEFVRKHDLWRHERRHLGVRPYKCSLCGKDFTDSGNIVKHLRVFHANEPNGHYTVDKNLLELTRNTLKNLNSLEGSAGSNSPSSANTEYADSAAPTVMASTSDAIANLLSENGLLASGIMNSMVSENLTDRQMLQELLNNT